MKTITKIHARLVFLDRRGLTHVVSIREDFMPWAGGWSRLEALCGKRVKHHDELKNRLVLDPADCMSCLARSQP